MPLYNNKVIKEEIAESKVLDHKAKNIDQNVKKELSHFNNSQKRPEGTAFQMDPLLAQITGHAKIQDEKIKEKVEKQALEQLKESQETAYKEAYELGRKEGEEKGIQEAQMLITEKIDRLEEEIDYLTNMRPKMMEHNEARLIEMIYKIASRIAMKEIAEDEEYIVELLKKLSSGIQQQMESTVRISQEDYDFIQNMGEKFKREVRLPKNAQLEPDQSLQHGECIIETNYGVVDASIEARLDKLWSTIKDTIPKSFSEGA